MIAIPISRQPKPSLLSPIAPLSPFLIAPCERFPAAACAPAHWATGGAHRSTRDGGECVLERQFLIAHDCTIKNRQLARLDLVLQFARLRGRDG